VPAAKLVAAACCCLLLAAACCLLLLRVAGRPAIHSHRYTWQPITTTCCKSLTPPAFHPPCRLPSSSQQNTTTVCTWGGGGGAERRRVLVNDRAKCQFYGVHRRVHEQHLCDGDHGPRQRRHRYVFAETKRTAHEGAGVGIGLVVGVRVLVVATALRVCHWCAAADHSPNMHTHLHFVLPLIPPPPPPLPPVHTTLTHVTLFVRFRSPTHARRLGLLFRDPGRRCLAVADR
jgi:hypothetical protein